MRRVLCETLVEHAGDAGLVFLTGDLGFMALEPLRDVLGERFINAGVAEQNMISVAAGLAMSGLSPWVYSIAPFIYARAFEQIRNDVCMHDLPVKFVGNGGGYGYGVMGATHHALEDYGVILTLENMHVLVPAFASDVSTMTRRLLGFPHPVYLRLGRCEKPKDLVLPDYAPWRRLLSGGGCVMVIVGPLAGPIIGALGNLEERVRPNVWVLTELPLENSTVPDEFVQDLQQSGHLFVVEEHVSQGGVGQMLPHYLLTRGISFRKFSHKCALGYVSSLYGSQVFHRKECGLDPAGIISELEV
ncbi:MAG: transketolase [Planctomycetes bacterium]|nr:transketolase [Planctomycetota bacterium]